MASKPLGRAYEDGEVIIREGEWGECMYVVQEGEVEVYAHRGGDDIRIAVRGEGELIGEMSIFDGEVRSASVRALGRAQLLTLDKKNFLSRIHEDPTLALRIVRTMSTRIRDLTAEVARLRGEHAEE